MLFASAPEDDIDWADVSPTGMHKWLSRVWRLTLEELARDDAGAPLSDAAAAGLRRATAEAIDRASAEYAARKYNTAIAQLMTLTNAVLDATRDGRGGPVVRESLEVLLTMLAPVCPFITEELWARLGHDASVHDQPWPVADRALLVDAEVEVVVQVNGKVRGRVTVPVGADAEAVGSVARGDARIAGYLAAEVVKVVFVPDKLVNFVVKA
jgi:leucyl-tRNA synthetase